VHVCGEKGLAFALSIHDSRILPPCFLFFFPFTVYRSPLTLLLLPFLLPWRSLFPKYSFSSVPLCVLTYADSMPARSLCLRWDGFAPM